MPQVKIILVGIFVLTLTGLLWGCLTGTAQFGPGPGFQTPKTGSTAATWDQNHYNSSCAVLRSSGGNSAATSSPSNVGDCLVYSTGGKTTGKWYAEIDASGGNAETAVGLGNTMSATLPTFTLFLGQNADMLGFYDVYNGGLVLNNNKQYYGLGPGWTHNGPTALCMAIDLTSASQRVWFLNISNGLGWNDHGRGGDNPAVHEGGFSLNEHGATVSSQPVVLALDVTPNAVMTLVATNPCVNATYGVGTSYLTGFSQF